MDTIYYNGNPITQSQSDTLFNLGYIDLSKRNYFEDLELILCKSDGTEITSLKDAYNIKLNLYLHDIDELEFDMPYYIEEQYAQVKNYNWDETEDYLLIKLNNKAVFVINSIIENGDEIQTKHVHAYNKEYLLSFRQLPLLQGTRQLYRDGSETTTSKVSYSLDGVNWVDYTAPFTTEDGKNVFIRRYDHLNTLIGSYVWNNKDKFAQIEGLDVTYKDANIFNKTIEISIRIVSETGEGLLNLLEQETSWKIGYIDADVREDRSLGQNHRKYRTFDISNQSWLDILYKTIPELFNCIVRIDSLNQTINIYDIDKFSENKGLYISKENYLKNIKKDLKNDDVITRLRVYGKDNLGISSINPTGEEFIEDFSYYRNSKYMDADLLQALNNYDNLKTTKGSQFNSYLQQITNLTDKKTVLENELVDLQMQKLQKEDERDMAIQHTSYHINYDTDIDNIDIDFSDIHGTNLSTYNAEIARIQALINSKENEIKNIEDDINIILAKIETLRNELDKKNNFTTEQLKVLNDFVREGSWENSNYSDVYELFTAGKQALSKLSKPSVEFSIGIIDFLNVVECQHDWDKLNIGDIINIYYDDFDLYVEAKIVKISHDIDNNNIEITVSNNNELDDDAKYISDLIKNSTEANSTINAFKHQWDLSSKNTDLISEIISSGLDATKNRISSARNQNITIDERGIGMKDLFDDNEQLRIVNNCLAMTTDSWESVNLAITPRGIIAEQLYGKIIGSNKLIITNMNENGESSFIVDGNHMKAINMDLSLENSIHMNRIYLNPDVGLKIQKKENGFWEDLLWLGMDGDIYAQSFHIINTDSVLDDNGLAVDNGKIKIINNNNYDAFYADEDGEMRLDGRMRVVRHLSEWTPSGVWDVEPESNRIILLDAYKDDEKGGKLLINDWNGNKNIFLGSAPNENYSGGFVKIFNGINENSQERIELGVLKTEDSGIIRIKNKESKNIIELKGDSDNRGLISVKNPINDYDIISMGGNNYGSYIVLRGNELNSINARFASINDELYDLVGGYIELFNENIDKLRVSIGTKKGEDAGSINLYGYDNKVKISISGIDDDRQSSGVIKLYNTANEPVIFFSAETNKNTMSRVNSQITLGGDVNFPKVGIYGGSTDFGGFIELSDKNGIPNLSLGDISTGILSGGLAVWYANMTANTYSERVDKRRIQIHVNSSKDGQIDLYDNSANTSPIGTIKVSNGEMIISHYSGSKIRFDSTGKIYFN